MLTWDLGAVNLMGTSYGIDDASPDPEPRFNDSYRPLRSGGGARLDFDEEAEWVQTLYVVSLGATLGAAETARNALGTVLTNALNSDGQTYTYSFQEDATASLKTWWLLGGRLVPVSKFPGTGRWYGVNGQYAALAVVTLGLSTG